MQEREMSNGDIKREFLGLKNEESVGDYDKRVLRKAGNKLKDPNLKKFSYIKIGRNAKCPCGSGKKFKKCCLDKINTGEFDVSK